jgi:proline iminopeptidase
VGLQNEKKGPERALREATKIVAPTYVYHPEFAQRITHDLTHYNAPGINQLVWQSMSNYDLRGAFAGFAVPTLVIDGRQDILGEQVPISIHTAIPGSQLELIDECAHYPWLDQPDKYFSLVRKFF